MRLFSFRRKESKPATIIQRIIDYMPEYYRAQGQFRNSVNYLEHREWGLALDSLIELAVETGHYFSEVFWLELANAAHNMNLQDKAAFCKAQIDRNKRDVNQKTPFGWTTIKIDDTHFQHHISDKLKDEWANERREKDKVWTLANHEGIHLISHGRSGFIYVVNRGRIAELEFELGYNGLILYFDNLVQWAIPTKIKMTDEEKDMIKRQLIVWSSDTKNAIEFF